jgi:hypothetical protein
MRRARLVVVPIAVLAVTGCSRGPATSVASDEVVAGQEGKPTPASFLGRAVNGRRPTWNGLTLGQTPAPWRDATRMPLPPAAVIGATGGLGQTNAADTVLSDDRDTWNPCFCAEIAPRTCAIRKYTPGTSDAAGVVEPAQRDDGQPTRLSWFTFSRLSAASGCNDHGNPVQETTWCQYVIGKDYQNDCRSQARGYYVRISEGLRPSRDGRDGAGVPITLDSFKKTFFLQTDSSGCSSYYNRDDLGVAGKLCCSFDGTTYRARDYSRTTGAETTTTTGPQAQACLLSAYGPFDDPVRAKANLRAGTGLLETVAIVYRPSQPTDRKVQFYLYDADGALKVSAQFDAFATTPAVRAVDPHSSFDRPVPEVCINCHGDSRDAYAKRGTFENGHFVPLNVPNFEPITGAGTGRDLPAADLATLRDMNCMMTKTPLTAEQTLFLSSLYTTAQGPCGSGAALKADADIVFPDWIANIPAGDIPKRKLLWKQMDHYCGGCHYSIRSDAIIGTTWATWEGKWGMSRPRICSSTTYTMPHASSTFTEFWKPRQITLGAIAYQSAAQFMVCNMGDDPKLCDNTACPGAPPPPPPPPPRCGDNVCDAGESCSSCPLDCGGCSDGDDRYDPDCSASCSTCWLDEVCYPTDTATATCGDGWCEPPGETCSSCPADCDICQSTVCGNGFCEAGETCSTCTSDCGVCQGPGPGSGSGSSGPMCGNGICEVGETCSACASDCGACPGPGSGSGSSGPMCGNGICEVGETCSACASDCGACPGPGSGSGSSGPMCGNGLCEVGETCSACASDCGVCPGPGSGSGSI